jgi:UDP-hydrolysing UDP-N-acetyl-D-glucosamine 2-epimerase
MNLEIVVTARASWARVKSLIKNYALLNGKRSIQVTFLGPITSTNYSSKLPELPEWLGYKKFETISDSDSLSGIAFSCINGSQVLINKWKDNKPDAVLVIADRTETLGVALAASVMQIPLIHLQGGEISGSIDDKIRDANTKLSDLHLTTNKFTRQRIIEMGEEPDLVHIVGCPSIDLLVETRSNLINLRSSSELGGVGSDFDLNDAFGIILFHPDTFNNEQNLNWIKKLIDLVINSELNWFWFWPGFDYGSKSISKLLRTFRENHDLSNTRFIVNLEPEIFLTLAIKCQIIVGNSSFGIRESAYLGLPSLNLGTRQKNRQKSSNVLSIEIPDSGMNLAEIYKSNFVNKSFSSSDLYGSGNSGILAAQFLSNWSPKVKRRN